LAKFVIVPFTDQLKATGLPALFIKVCHLPPQLFGFCRGRRRQNSGKRFTVIKQPRFSCHHPVLCGSVGYTTIGKRRTLPPLTKARGSNFVIRGRLMAPEPQVFHFFPGIKGGKKGGERIVSLLHCQISLIKKPSRGRAYAYLYD